MREEAGVAGSGVPVGSGAFPATAVGRSYGGAAARVPGCSRSTTGSKSAASNTLTWRWERTGWNGSMEFCFIGFVGDRDDGTSLNRHGALIYQRA